MSSRHLTRRRFLQLGGVTAAVGLLQACGATPAAPASTPAPSGSGAPPAATQAPAATQSTASGAPGQKETFIFGMGAEPDNLDPHVTTSGQAASTMQRIYDQLVRYKPGIPKPGEPIEMIPDAAESWQMSPDGKQYTFKLRKGLKFADGTALDAKAVKFSFDRLMGVNKGAASQLRVLKSTEVVDETTVQMSLSDPFAYFLHTVGTWQFGIVNPKVMDHQKDNDWGQAYLAGNAMGSGPYVLTEWRRAQQLQLDYNPNWYGKVPQTKRVLVKIVPETTSQLLQMEKGDLDSMMPVGISEMLTLAGKPGVKMLEAPGTRYILAYLNNKKPPLDDVRVRQALNYAIDYDAIIDNVIQGKGRRLRGPLGYGVEGYDENLKGYDYDPQKAKQLLSEAGYPNGFEILLTYASQGAPGADDVALASQANFADIGVDVKIERVAEPTRRERIDKGDFTWSIGSWVTQPLPPQTMSRWYLTKNHGLNANRAFYTNAKFDELVNEAEATVDAKKRIELYQEAQRICVEECPYLLYYQSDQVLAFRDNIEGFEWIPGNSSFLFYEELRKV